MKYCWNCGAQLQNKNSKFCSECGTNLLHESDAKIERPPGQVDNESSESRSVGSKTITAKELGSTLEDNVATIFKQMGYSVELRRRFSTQSGTAEIDIVLTKGSRKRGVECKNYDISRNVGIKELRDFKGRLDQVGIISGLFVTSTIFSGEAEQYADSNGIETWDRSTLQEKLMAYFTGRVGVQRAETVDALPVAQRFEQASVLNLRNKEAVKLFAALLIYHPYHLVKYRAYGRRKDPTGKIHKISDEGVCIVDALDGDVVNRDYSFADGVGGILRSKEQRQEREEAKSVSRELVEKSPERQTPAPTGEYQVKVLQPQVSDNTAWKVARDAVIDKNSRVVHYQSKRSDDSLFGVLDSPSIKVVPRESEVTRRGQSLAFVPKWDIQWEAGQMTFQRRIIASSGKVIRDSIAKCAKCSIVHRATVAVCETCGLPLCEKHSYEKSTLSFVRITSLMN